MHSGPIVTMGLSFPVLFVAKSESLLKGEQEMKIFDHFMENPYWKSILENAPSDECREYYRIMFEYFSFGTEGADEAAIRSAGERLAELMLTREDAEYIKAHAGSGTAEHHYKAIIRRFFDDQSSDAVPASMFKGEIRNPDYTPASIETMVSKNPRNELSVDEFKGK